MIYYLDLENEYRKAMASNRVKLGEYMDNTTPSSSTMNNVQNDVSPMYPFDEEYNQGKCEFSLYIFIMMEKVINY